MGNEGRSGEEDIDIPGLVDLEFVGRGGAAVVYKAKQTSLQRTVAVKVLTSNWDESVARRFDREQRAMGRLSSQPGIVPVYESGLSASGAPYIVMPYYPDGSLKDYSEREGPIPWERAVELMLDVAEAVGRAHDEGVVHRDLKPANILVSGTGRPLVADFGIARLASDGAGIETTAVAFTPAYCPPEVLDESDPSPEADTYALAATFWALVRGRPPFTDSHTVLGMEAVLKRVLIEPPPRLDELPDPVASFIERAMSKTPEERPANGRAFAAQLREAVEAAKTTGSAWSTGSANDATIIRQVPTKSAVPTNESGNQRKLMIGGAAVLFAAIAVGLFAFLQTQGGDTEQADEVAGISAPNIVVIPDGEAMQVLPLSPEIGSEPSEEAQRSAAIALADVGPIQGVAVELLPELEVPCGAELSESSETAIAETSAVVLVGATCSTSARSVMEAAEQRQMSWISASLGLSTLTANADGSAGSDHVDGFFRIARNDQFQGLVAAQYAIQELGAESAVVVHGDFAGAAETADAFAASFGVTGDVTVIEVTSAGDLSGPIGDWNATRADVAFWVLDAETALAFASATEDGINSTVPRLTVDGVLTSATARQRVMTGTLVVVPQSPDDSAVAATGRSLVEIVDEYEATFGAPPEDLLGFASAYDAMVLALDAIEATAVASDDGLTIDREALRLQLEAASADGLTGRITCDLLGDCGSQSFAIVEMDGVSEASTLENVVKLFSRES